MGMNNNGPLLQEEIKKKARIVVYNIIRQVNGYPNISVAKTDDYKKIEINSTHEYFPDFVFEWCPGKEHFRVYIHVGHTDKRKERSGYCICAIKGGIASAGFVTLYSFLYKHRSNKKSEEQ